MEEKKVKKIFSDIRFQIAYGIFLMLVIPLLIVINTFFILGRYTTSIDVSLQRRALLIGRVFHSATQDDLYSSASLQQTIESIARASTDILDLQILTPLGEDFVITAALNPELVGQNVSFYYYHLAWQQKKNEALATDSLTIEFADEALNETYNNSSERFWLVSLPLFDAYGKKHSLLSMKLSSQVVDNLLADNWRATLFSLTLTILIVFLFLAASTRLWAYAELYRKLKSVDAMKDEFISVASHELRTPISALSGSVQMALDGDLGSMSPKMKKIMTLAQHSTKRLGTLVEDLLDVSRIEQGRMKFDLKPVDIVPIVSETVESMKITASKKNILMVVKKPKGEIPKIFIDADKFRQVLVNIVGNAVKYTKKGEVVISVLYNKQKNSVIIKVKDTGVGISAQDQQRLFEKFYRVQNDQTEKISGTGLGLWITRQLVLKMKGKIFIESIEGAGTQVTVEFSIVKKGIRNT